MAAGAAVLRAASDEEDLVTAIGLFIVAGC